MPTYQVLLEGLGNVVPALIDSQLLDVQSSFFKMSMKSNCMWAMENFGDLNPVSMISWQKLSMNALLASKLPEFHKLAEMVVVQIMGSVEDERVFSTLSFMKTKLRSKLTDHFVVSLCIAIRTCRRSKANTHYMCLMANPYNINAVMHNHWIAPLAEYHALATQLARDKQSPLKLGHCLPTRTTTCRRR